MTTQTRSTLPHRAWRLLGLLFLGMGLSQCHSEPGGADAGADAGVDAGLDVDAGSPFPTVTHDARLLQVDEKQTVLFSLREDGTYAQGLPTGEPSRITAGLAEAAFMPRSDSHAAVLWGAEVAGVRTVWLWRPGTPEAIVLTARAWGPVFHDAALSYVAFTERDEAGAAFVRVARTATCMPSDCVLVTLMQFQDGAFTLRNGGNTLFAAKGPQRWLIDVPTGTVTDLGVPPGPSFLSPGGTRYGWAVDDHVLVFDTATGAPLWDQVWLPRTADPESKPTSAFMMSEEKVFVNSEGHWVGAPVGYPPIHDLLACTAEGCSGVISRHSCSAFTLQGQAALWCRMDPCVEIRCNYYDPFLDTDGHPISGRSSSDTKLGPAFSQGFKNSLQLKGTQGQLHWLEWEHDYKVTKLNLDAPYPTAPLLFVPDGQRVVYHQPVAGPDGTQQNHLWTWNQAERVDLGTLEGPPGSTALVRDNPPTLYLDVTRLREDGSQATSIVRVAL